MIFIKIGFIGAGKVGFSLGKFFTSNNIEVSGYYSRSEDSALEASLFTGTKHFRNVEELVNESTIIFITVPDDEIYNVYLKMKNNSLHGKILCHSSGSLSSHVFSDIDNFGAYSYSIHPIFPISSKYESYKALKDAVFTIEGHEHYLPLLLKLFTSMNVNIIPLKASDKSLYHLASVTVSNIFLALLNRSCRYLEAYGFDEQDALAALYPLILNNINNAMDKGITKALTGPAERGDLGTIKKHLAAMPYEHQSVYKQLTGELIPIAEAKNETRDYSVIKDFFKNSSDAENYNLKDKDRSEVNEKHCRKL